MPLKKWATKSGLGILISTTALGGAYWYAVTPHPSSAPTESAAGILNRADALSWTNRWAEAQPLYTKAALLYATQGQHAKALYARVSEIPADESTSDYSNILLLTEALATPAGQVPATRLRILTIRGMLETNYDAGEALKTWREVERLAVNQGKLELATRAGGEQGIADFILGDTTTAKVQVVKAWGLSRIEHDPAATVRYAAIYGAGLVQIHRYKEALTPLNNAIALADRDHEIAYPTIAVYAEIDALAGLHRYNQALQLADACLRRLKGTPYDGHKMQVYISRGSIEKAQGDMSAAVDDYQQAISISQRIGNYRGIVNAGGLLALAYEKQNNLPEAIKSVDAAITANTKIPDELYLVPRNLAIKADIEAKRGHLSQADVLYQEAITLVNRMMQHSPTTNVQRQLLAEMSDVYSGYFATLCTQHRYNEALQILDNVRGRVETEALQHHQSEPVHAPTAAEQKLTQLNLSLINTDNPALRATLSSAIYTTELGMKSSLIARETIEHPVTLPELQKTLGPRTLLIEYVLAEPSSYVLAITHDSVQPYKLPSKGEIEADANRYRKEIRSQKEDKQLAGQLFAELLGPVAAYKNAEDLIVVPDGALHLLPFSVLQDGAGYVLASHTVDVDPSATVSFMLYKRTSHEQPEALPYIGVAAWTQPTDTRNPILRAVSGPERSELVPLPESKSEVESIAKDLPRPSTILEGADATETHFKSLPLDDTEVIHLALHGYADLDYPDRSALIFAPEPNGANDGLLQVREIREMHLRSKLVTLSACDTGVGPVGETGVSNLVNAFIEAGADSVVSTLWEVSDLSTTQLMKDFYGQIATHSRKVDALRTAQLDMMKEGLMPYFWAGFQIVGNANGSL
jgi:CHAT domain-containing protein/tetratricopeptide (TPR) repeat protein